MKAHRLILCALLTIVVAAAIPHPTVTAQEYYQYNVEIQSDGSAVWTIQQFSAFNAPVASWQDLRSKILQLISDVENFTGRQMTVDESLIRISTSTVAESSKTTVYSFVLMNFSTVENQKITFGDVFRDHNFFGLLFGDAALEVTYPQDYTVESVSPEPFDHQTDVHTMRWVRTQDLIENPANIVLVYSPQFLSLQNILIILIAIFLVIVVILAYLLIKRRNPKKPAPAPQQPPQQKTPPQPAPNPTLLQSEEEKIVKLLKSNGGAMRQSEITDKLHFSKAKTSQLVSQLEEQGQVTRLKKGRDKIVSLAEQNTQP